MESCSVPSAINLPFTDIYVSGLNTTVTPGSIVNVTPSLTTTLPVM